MSKKSKDPLGDRMKLYEGAEAERMLMPLLPIVARIDGVTFSKFTQGMDRPFDVRLRAAMTETVKRLVKETHALIGYTQSDEITLIWDHPDFHEDRWFSGRVQKICTSLATQATMYFFREIQRTMPEYADREPRFDARVFNTPNKVEAVNNLLWREQDATKNSITQLAHCSFAHDELQFKTGPEKLDMLIAKGINWNSWPASYKRGVYVRRQEREFPFTTDEIALLPARHAARTNPNLTVKRSVVDVLEMPIFQKVTNRSAVVFEGATPTTGGFFNPEHPCCAEHAEQYARGSL